MYKKVLSVLALLGVILAAGCTPAATPTPAPPSTSEAPIVTTAAPATAVPTAVINTAVPETTLTVMAAASLTESFTELGSQFEAQHPGVKVVYNFAGSQQLVEQLTQGAAADVFASASKKYMTSAIDAKLVVDTDSHVFARNRLIVIYPKNNKAGIAALTDLAKPGIKVVLAAQVVPVGQYALDFLDKAVKDPAFGASYKDNVIKNVVSYEDNVKAVLTKVSLDEADAGIVYVTDITADAKASVGTLDIPDALNTIATYPIARLSASKNADLAEAYVSFVLSPEGQAVLSKYGFQRPN